MNTMKCRGSCILKENKSRKCVNRYERGFCVIIPVYNESKRVSHLMMEVNEFLLRHKTCEVLISDDGSTDDTVNKVIKLGQTNRLKVLKCRHQGKWGALREGFFAARHKDVVFLDADLSVGFDQAKTAVYFLNSMAQVVAGNRYGSMDSEVPLKRKVLSRGFAALVKVLANVPILDTQCLPVGEEMCVMKDGVMMFLPVEKIYDLEGDFLILTKYGFERCLRKFKREYDGNLLTIRATYGKRSRMTSDHPVLTKRGFVKAVDLKIGDLLEEVDAIGLPYSAPDHFDVLELCSEFESEIDAFNKIVFRGGRNHYSRAIEVDREFGYVMGLFQAEGSLDTCKKRSLRFSFHVNEMMFRQRVSRYFAKFGGSYSECKPVDNCMTVAAGSLPHSILYSKIYGGEKNLIPEFIFSCREDVKWGFLSGLFCGDGCLNVVGKRLHLTLSTCARNAFRLRLLLLSVGVRCSIVYEQRHGGNQCSVRIITNDLRKFLVNCVEVMHKYERRGLQRGDLSDLKIRETEVTGISSENYVGPVFNFETEVSHTLYHGGLVSHNCPMKAITRNEDTCWAVDAMDERGFIGDVEFFILMRDAGVNMANMPVRYVFKQGGFKVVRNTLRMFAGLVRVCWKYAGEPVMLR